MRRLGDNGDVGSGGNSIVSSGSGIDNHDDVSNRWAVVPARQQAPASHQVNQSV